MIARVEAGNSQVRVINKPGIQTYGWLFSFWIPRMSELIAPESRTKPSRGLLTDGQQENGGTKNPEPSDPGFENFLNGSELATEDLDLNVMVHGIGGVALGVEAHVLAFDSVGVNQLAFVRFDIGFVLTTAQSG